MFSRKKHNDELEQTRSAMIALVATFGERLSGMDARLDALSAKLTALPDAFEGKSVTHAFAEIGRLSEQVGRLRRENELLASGEDGLLRLAASTAAWRFEHPEAAEQIEREELAHAHES